MIAALVIVFRHFQLFEPDVFLLDRFGEELLAGGYWPANAPDTWTSVARGAPWTNVQWLASVLIHELHRIDPQWRWASLLQAALFAAVSLGLSGLVWIGVEDEGERREGGALIAQALIVPVVLAATYRFTLRAELFALPLYPLLLLLWLRRKRDEGCVRRRPLLGLVLLVLWSNLHGGAVVLGIVTSVYFVLFGELLRAEPLAKRFALALACCATWLATPVTYHALEAWWRHASLAGRM